MRQERGAPGSGRAPLKGTGKGRQRIGKNMVLENARGNLVFYKAIKTTYVEGNTYLPYCTDSKEDGVFT